MRGQHVQLQTALAVLPLFSKRRQSGLHITPKAANVHNLEGWTQQTSTLLLAHDVYYWRHFKIRLELQSVGM